MYAGNLSSKGINFFDFIKKTSHSDFVSLLKLYLEDQSISFIQTFQAVQLGSGNVNEKDGKEVLENYIIRLDYLENNKNALNENIKSKRGDDYTYKENKKGNTSSFNIKTSGGINKLIEFL